MLFVCVSMDILAMFDFLSLFNGAAYLNKRRAIDILNIVPLVHVGCVAVTCRVPEKLAVEKISCLSIRLHDLMKHSKSKIAT